MSERSHGFIKFEFPEFDNSLQVIEGSIDTMLLTFTSVRHGFENFNSFFGHFSIKKMTLVLIIIMIFLGSS